MSKKLLSLVISIFVVSVPLVLLFVCTTKGYADRPSGFEGANPSEQAEEAIDAHKPITPGGKYERVVFIHYAKGGIPGPPDKGEEPDEPGPDNSHFEPLGYDWNWLVSGEPPIPIHFVIDPDYAPNGSVDQIIAALEAWDSETDAELFDYPEEDVSAAPSPQEVDFVNTVSWRRVVPPKAIAVTFMWHVGPDIVDCDVVMNTRHNWGIDSDGEGGDILEDAFDVRNIFTHEAGHVIGLADLYDDVYRELTMYGYGSIGETQKISLEAGDIAGCQALYGE